MKQQTQVQRTLEEIYGPDQAKGITYLSSVLDIEQLYREKAAPICINTPELDSLTTDTVEALSDVDKVTITVLLDSLSSLSTQKNTPNGFTWEELQNVLAQAGFLEPLPSRQRQGISKDVRGKRKVRWFRRNGDPGIEPNPEAVYELLLQIFEQDSETKSVDLDPLRRLVSEPNAESVDSPSAEREPGDSPLSKGKTAARGPAKRIVVESSPLEGESLEGPTTKREPIRGNSMDSTRSLAHSLGRAARHALHRPCHSDPNAPHLAKAKRGKKTVSKTPSSRLANSSVVLNASSAQKYSLEPRSSTDWPVMEIITLRFPTVKEPYFTASRLTVKAWASVDRRLILPRAQTVIRIETMSKVFGARKEFIETADESARQHALTRAKSLFSLA